MVKPVFENVVDMVGGLLKADKKKKKKKIKVVPAKYVSETIKEIKPRVRAIPVRPVPILPPRIPLPAAADAVAPVYAGPLPYPPFGFRVDFPQPPPLRRPLKLDGTPKKKPGPKGKFRPEEEAKEQELEALPLSREEATAAERARAFVNKKIYEAEIEAPPVGIRFDFPPPPPLRRELKLDGTPKKKPGPKGKFRPTEAEAEDNRKRERAIAIGNARAEAEARVEAEDRGQRILQYLREQEAEINPRDPSALAPSKFPSYQSEARLGSGKMKKSKK